MSLVDGSSVVFAASIFRGTSVILGVCVLTVVVGVRPVVCKVVLGLQRLTDGSRSSGTETVWVSTPVLVEKEGRQKN